MSSIRQRDPLPIEDGHHPLELDTADDNETADEDNSILEDGDSTDDEQFVLRSAIQNSLQDAKIQSACLQHEGTCDCAPGPSSATQALAQAKRVKSKATDETDDILLEAIDDFDPLNKSRKEVAACWEKVADSCRTRGAIVLRKTEKATHFADATAKSVRQRWMQLRKGLDQAKAARTKHPTGTVQADLSKKLRTVEALVNREEGKRTHAQLKKRQEMKKRRQNYMTGRVMAKLPMSTNQGLHGTSATSDATDSDIASDSGQERVRSPTSSIFFSGRSANTLFSTFDLISTIQDRMAELDKTVAEVREQERVRHEASQAELRHITSVITQSLESDREDRKVLLGALDRLTNTQESIVQLLLKMNEK
ncbi:hypothetical protein EC957_010680 [Mortierella hygrophila]|uniref:Uncharacterized protein n=1 Tax=Mortierella hygrophila TaxID=979708 RepID=A0A9P6F9H8_9FUNG|nr:hypothetical protein EC957_010680 [Mortierella hygrophila]